MNKNRPFKIVISGGHTGGHFFPAISFAKGFKQVHSEVEIHILLGCVPIFAKTLITDNHFKSHLIEIPPFPKIFSLKLIAFLLKYFPVYFRTFVYLWNLKPSLVVGFGSYASVPSVLCASVLGIPILLHEQNYMAGRANRLLSYCVNRVAVSFPETKGIKENKLVLTGYPLREEFLNLVEGPYQATKDRFEILVFGGSQGARKLNDLFLFIIERLSAEEKKEIAVKHIAGIEDLNRIKLQYERLGIQAEVIAFSDHIEEDYRSADLIISRSGAGTVFELIAAGRPAILVPYPHAYAHQKLNAEYLSKRGAAVIIPEEKLTAEVLTDTVLNLKNNPDQRTNLIHHLKQLYKPNATENLVQLAWELSCIKN